MKCPLSLIGENDRDNMLENEAFDCLQEECSWWDDSCQQCSVLSLSWTLVAIGNTLGKIADRKSINVQIAK